MHEKHFLLEHANIVPIFIEGRMNSQEFNEQGDHSSVVFPSLVLTIAILLRHGSLARQRLHEKH